MSAADLPIARLNDSYAAQLGTPVYEIIDPVTNRRFLVVKAEIGIAMIEATPVPVQVPVVVMTPPVLVVPPGPPKYWEEAQSYSFGPGQIAKGWELLGTTEVLGHKLYHIRRKNPNYNGPPLDQLPLEK